MGGEATFSGTTYQARVIAYIYVHILAQMRLGWLSPTDDTPIAVSGETEGPGDDARIEFGDRHSPVELQAKHGLTAGAKLQEVVDRIRTKSPPNDPTLIVLTVDRNSSRKLYTNFAGDLDRLRMGRTDKLAAETTRILRDLGGDSTVLQRLFVIPLDLDRAQDSDAKFALRLLAESVLENPEKAVSAWSELVTNAGDLCARKGRQTRKDLVNLLAGANISVRHPAKDDRWHRQLDFSRELLRKRHAAAALAFLTKVESELGGLTIDPHVRYRIAQQRAGALLQLNRLDESLKSSRRALELEPSGSPALQTAAIAALRSGDIALAKAFAERGLTAHPDDAHLWGARAQVAAAAGDPLPSPPKGVAMSPHYRTVLAEIASIENNWQRVLALTTGLLADDVRLPEVLFLRADALLAMPEAGNSIADRERLETAEQLASELIDSVSDDGHPLSRKGLVLRASARRHLGRVEDADADLQRVRELTTDDPDAIYYSADAKIEQGREDDALDILRHPTVDEYSPLLAMRSKLFAKRGEELLARRDMDEALRHIGTARDPDVVRFMVADTALALDDVSFANRVLSEVTPKRRTDGRYVILHGRLAFSQGNIDEGVSRYREATKTVGMRHTEVLAELGNQLLKVDKPGEAVQVFQEVGATELPAKVLQSYATALMQSNNLVSAQALVDLLTSKGALPNWALSLATNIALRQENIDEAVRHLTALIERGQPSPRARITLVRLLAEHNRIADSRRHLDALLTDPELAPFERMQLAHLLQSDGREDEALSIAFRAFRDAPEDPKLHRGLIMLVLELDATLPEASEVGQDTHVLLRNQEGDIREHTIYSTPPINALRGEMDLSAAAAADLIGKKIGDIVLQNKGSWQEQRWKVEQIVPAMLYAAQDAMQHYAQRFPQEPFFISRFSLGEPNSVKFFIPLIASTEARKARISEAIKLYREHGLPLGFIAKMMGGTIPAVMQHAASNPSAFGPLTIESGSRADHDKARSIALTATTIVVTRSALKTAFDLGTLELLSSGYKLLAPRSLVQELRQEMRDAERLVVKGQSLIMGTESGLHLHQLPPGHPYLTKQLEDARRLLGWIEASARIEPRPLASIHPLDSREEEIRDFIGHSSLDAIALSQHYGAAMHADDFGLRRIFPKGPLELSFSTLTLLSVLAERDIISTEKRDRHLIAIATRNYSPVPPSRELLITALRQASELRRSGASLVFALLGGPTTTLAGSARIAAQTIKWLVTSPIEIVPLRTVVGLILQGMITKWPAPLCSQTVSHAAADELALLPRQLLIVRRVCSDFARQALPQL